jgi:hypothetical protein
MSGAESGVCSGERWGDLEMAAIQTVRCQKCGHENRLGAKFCAHCGSPLPRPEDLPKTPPSDATPPAPIVTEEAKEAAKKLWEIVKTVVTVGGRTAWLELTNPEPVLEGTLTERLKVESVTMPKESAFWLTIVAGIVLLVFALTGGWLFPFLATVAFLVLSWLKWRRPYFSALSWTNLGGLLSKQVPSWNLKVRTDKGEVQVVAYGDASGDEPQIGDRVRVWGIFDDKAQTRLRAWKIQAMDATGKPKGQPFTFPRLFPLMPTLFFLSLVMFVLSLLASIRFG